MQNKGVREIQKVNRTFAEHMKLIRMGYVPKPDDPTKWQIKLGPRNIRHLDGVLPSVRALINETCFEEYRK